MRIKLTIIAAAVACAAAIAPAGAAALTIGISAGSPLTVTLMKYGSATCHVTPTADDPGLWGYEVDLRPKQVTTVGLFGGLVATGQEQGFVLGPPPIRALVATIDWGDGGQSAGLVLYSGYRSVAGFAEQDQFSVFGGHDYGPNPGDYAGTLTVQVTGHPSTRCQTPFTATVLPQGG